MNQTVLNMLNGFRDNDGYIDVEDLPSEFELVSGDPYEWTQEHKYQMNDVVVRHIPSDTYWTMWNSRSGSYHSDWYYDPTQIEQVSRHEEVVTKVVITWKAVK